MRFQLIGKYASTIALVILMILCTGCLLVSAQAPAVFTHPGAISNKADLDFVKAKLAINAEPWNTAYNQMLTIATNYNGTTAPQDGAENAQKADARQCYANALAWYFTGNANYADNAIRILNVWGNTFNGYAVPAVGQGSQSQLNAGWIGALFGPAAEIMRSYSGWTTTDRTIVQNMFRTRFYPALKQMSTWNGNNDLTQIDALINIAVFNEDATEFNLAIQRLNARNPSYFYLASDGGVPAIAGDGNNVNTFWSNPTQWVDGLTQETCRDYNHHAQFALASALHAAETAWNQGVDVYTPNTDRYIAALELMAQQMVTGSMQGTCANNVTSASVFNTFEVGYNHYHNRMGLTLPNTYQVITQRIRPNGASDWNIFFETLTHGEVSSLVQPCTKPKLGPNQSLCGKTNIVLNASVPTNGKSFVWFRNNASISGQNAVSLTVNQPGTYKVNIDSAGCLSSGSVVIANTLSVDLGADKDLCTATQYTLDAGNSTNSVNFKWNTGETTRTKLVSKAGTYTVTVSALNCTPVSDVINIGSKLLPVVNDTICAAGIANLSVSTTGTFAWYDVSTSGSILGTGVSFKPSITTNKTYYVEDQGAVSAIVGKTSMGTGQTWTLGPTDFASADKTNSLTVTKALTFNSVAVYVVAAGLNVTINLKQSGITVFTKTVTNVGSGKQTIPLGFNLTPGNYTIDAVGTTATLYFESSGGTFPYSYPGYLSFTYVQQWQSNWYGSFYEWNVGVGNACARTPVNAVINANKPSCNSLTEVPVTEESSKIEIYPNPASQWITIKIGRNQNAENLVISNVYGEVVSQWSMKANQSETTIDFSNYSSGLYFVAIGNMKKKIMIER